MQQYIIFLIPRAVLTFGVKGHGFTRGAWVDGTPVDGATLVNVGLGRLGAGGSY